MDLTIMSVITTSLLMSLFIFTFCIFFRKGTVLRQIGPKCMIVLLLVMLIRMFLPFEFPYTYSIYIEDVFTPFRRFLEVTMFTIGKFKWTVWHTIIFLWTAGAIFLLLYRMRAYRKIFRLIALLPKEEWGSFCTKYQINQEELKNSKDVQIAYYNDISSPCLVGLKKRYLILPELDYGKEQMRYIVLHELSHARNWDIAWKLLIELLCTIFWWNPAFWHLKGEFFRLIELRNDLLVTENLSEEEKTGYMECLKETALQMAGRDTATSAAFNRSSFQLLKERLELLASGKPFSRRFQIVISVFVCMTMIFSSAVVFEPFSYCELDDADVIPTTPESTYLIKNGEQYDVYIDREYFLTIENLNSFYGFKIYNNAEEAEKNEK